MINSIQPPDRQTARLANRPTGFTLLELLVVIAIIMTISSILVASYFGMMRGSSYAAAKKNVFNALTLARQSACINGKRTYLMFQSSNEFVLVHSAGRVTDVGSGYFDDAYADTSAGLRESRVYNMDSNGTTMVRSVLRFANSAPRNPITGASYARAEIRYLVDDSSSFARGDRYGYEVFQSQQLPKGFYCTVDGATPTADNMLRVVFNPDGTRGPGSIENITVIERIASATAASGSDRVIFTIEPSGKISINDVGTP